VLCKFHEAYLKTTCHTEKKNNQTASPSIWNNDLSEFSFEKERPGRGFFHAISKPILLDFFALIPKWDEISVGLKGVRLVERQKGVDGWYHHDRVICICAWERELWRTVSDDFFLEHRQLLERLNVEYEQTDCGWLLKHTEETVRAYQLLHIFLHELGHHCDLMSTKRAKKPGRGEQFAEGWALEHERKIWEKYQNTFGVP